MAAIGSLEAARDGLVAVMEGSYPGKVVIFPQIHGLPLMGLDELEDKLPEVAAKLGEGDTWTTEAEAALIEKYWNPPE